MKEYSYTINGVKYHVEIIDIEDNIAQVEVNGTRYEVELDNKPKEKPLTRAMTRTPRPATPVSTPVASSSPSPQPATPTPSASGSTGGTKLQSPLPGVILRIEVKVGDAVKKGQRIMVLEAMKMENDIKASKDGTILSLDVREGDNIQEGATLATIG